MLVSEIAKRVYRDFGDDVQAQIDDTDIIRWINDAMRELVLDNKLLEITGTSAVTSGSVSFTLPTTLIELQAVKWNGISLQNLTQQEADSYVEINGAATSQLPSGTPCYYWRYGNTINLLPVPDTNGTANILYRRLPNDVTATTDTPELPSQWHNRIVEYCKAMACSLDDNMHKSDLHMQAFKGNSAAMKENAGWEQQEFYPHITATPEDTEDLYIGYY